MLYHENILSTVEARDSERSCYYLYFILLETLITTKYKIYITVYKIIIITNILANEDLIVMNIHVKDGLNVSK